MSTDPLESSPPPSHGIATLAMIGSAACWGLATVMSKGALSILPPLSLLTAQLSASIVLIWTLLLCVQGVPRISGPMRLAALNGVLEPGLSYVVGMQGLALTSAANASLIGATEPVLSLALLFVVFRERSRWRDVIAIALAVVGAGLVTATGGGAGGKEGSVHFAGDMLVVASTLFAALYVVLSSRLADHAPPLLLAGLQQSVGFVIILSATVVSLIAGWESISHWPTTGEWLFIVFSGVAQHTLPFWLYLYAVRTIPVQKAALYLTLIPVFGVSGAVAFLGEPVGAMQMGGSALIVVALLAASFDRKMIMKRDRPPL
ncbi:EamA-like transporter family protein [Methyloligella halotolerans]|uniref:EamA-like transporter family protein n=1 Tax=Methyloligella halotolerans TaxID=1177755 RepID=A0A1E2RXB0_9HYPH|nr:DMT family transporter [Methyloligella halotolerans]ODA66755.1 EamA-like transporter family protein [Methyloligella halotolerans]